MNPQNLHYKMLGIYQLLGGIIGIGLTIWILLSVQVQFVGQYFFIVVAFLLYLYSIFCGLMLLKNKKKGLRLSLVNQLFQIVNLSIVGFAYKYISGFFLSFGLDLTNNNLLFNFGTSSWELAINTNSIISEVHINLIALFLVFFIERLIGKSLYNEDSTLEKERSNLVIQKKEAE